MPYVRRVEQGFHDGPDLVVELTGEYFADVAGAEAQYTACGHNEPGPERTLRLTWESRWEEVDGGLNGGGVTLHHSEHIYFLETYEEFYAGPFGTYHPSKQGVEHVGAGLYEVVNDPDPWILEILRENDNTDTFPPYPPTALEYHRETDTFSGPGRFRGNKVEGGPFHDYFWTGPNPPTPEEQAEMDRQVKRNREAQAALERARPRYRHLFISSNSVMVELLCEGLPRWEWVELP